MDYKNGVAVVGQLHYFCYNINSNTFKIIGDIMITFDFFNDSATEI